MLIIKMYTFCKRDLKKHEESLLIQAKKLSIYLDMYIYGTYLCINIHAKDGLLFPLRNMRWERVVTPLVTLNDPQLVIVRKSVHIKSRDVRIQDCTLVRINREITSS